MAHTIRITLLTGDKKIIEDLHIIDAPTTYIADAKAALLRARPDADTARVRYAVLPPSYGPHIRQHKPETVIEAVS